MQFLTAFTILTLLSGSALANLISKRATAEVINNCNQDGTVALTYDDGPYNYEQDIMSALDGNKGTFFYNGNNYDCIYNRADDIKAVYNAGHTIGSHTWSHSDVTTLSDSDLNSELSKVEDAFVKILGVKPKYFRPPYGNINDQALQVLADRGYTKVFLWSDDTEDSLGAGAAKGEEVLHGVAADYPNPHLVLSHSTYQQNPDTVIPHSIPKLEAAGYKIVTVGECLGTDESPYEYVGEPQSNDGSWTC